MGDYLEIRRLYSMEKKLKTPIVYRNTEPETAQVTPLITKK
jgi:hypothetical protein